MRSFARTSLRLLCVLCVSAVPFFFVCRAGADDALDPARLGETDLAKPVLLVVLAPASRNSRRFDSEVLASEPLRAALTRDWTVVRAAPPDEVVATRYGVTLSPTLVVLDRLGGLVTRIEGERPADLLLPELAEALAAAKAQEPSTRAALERGGGAAAERQRVQLLLRRGLGSRAVPALEALVAGDPGNEGGEELFARAKLATIAYERGDVAGGDSHLARVAVLAGEGVRATEVRRDRARALRRTRRFLEAREELARIAASPLAGEDERALLGLEEAAILRQEGLAADARAKLEALWETTTGAVHAKVEAELDADPGPTPGAWRTLRDGRRLVARLGCAECHAVEPAVALETAASCVRCHQEIKAGYPVDRERRDALALEPELHSHERNVRHYLFAPDLGTTAVRLRREWLRAFLRRPVDVRPFLAESMPRLPLEDAEIETVLDYLEAVGKRATGDLAPPPIVAGDPARGEALFQAKRCQTCHVFGNRVFPGSPAGKPWPRAVPANVRAAPNLRWARARFRRELLPLWLRDARRFVPGSPMPTFELSDQEVGDLVAFLERGDLGAPAPLAPAPILPGARPTATLVESARDVFLDTCKHCHLRDEAGGIGNAGGGFGYEPRGLDLESETGLRRGSLSRSGRRRSVLVAGEGEPRAPLLARLLWRRDENRFDAWAPYEDPLVPIPTERYDHPPGMPLGLPALDDEEAGLLRAYAEAAASR